MLITASSQAHNKDIVSIFFNMKVCCVFSLESPQRGNYNEYHYYYRKKKITLNYPKYDMSAAKGCFPRDSRTRSK